MKMRQVSALSPPLPASASPPQKGEQHFTELQEFRFKPHAQYSKPQHPQALSPKTPWNIPYTLNPVNPLSAASSASFWRCFSRLGFWGSQVLGPVTWSKTGLEFGFQGFGFSGLRKSRRHPPAPPKLYISQTQTLTGRLKSSLP